VGNVKVMISIPQAFLEEVDRAAREEHRSRSEFFREAARLYLQVRAFRHRPIDDPRVQRAVALMEQLARRDRPVPGWDAAAAVRAERERDRG
jgi:metal-responsive CopG/Arc/MetJ family transcriptional regulator